MNGLYPIVRRVRRPYVELDPPAPPAGPEPEGGSRVPLVVNAPEAGGGADVQTVPIVMKARKDSHHARPRKSAAPGAA